VVTFYFRSSLLQWFTCRTYGAKKRFASYVATYRSYGA